jgi:excisionase family DNA binding protein
MNTLIDAKEVSKILAVSPARVYELTRRHLIPHTHIGRQVRYDPAILMEWIRNGGQALDGGWKYEPADLPR